MAEDQLPPLPERLRRIAAFAVLALLAPSSALGSGVGVPAVSQAAGVTLGRTHDCFGGRGNDYLGGGRGDDTLRGGPGRDFIADMLDFGFHEPVRGRAFIQGGP